MSERIPKELSDYLEYAAHDSEDYEVVATLKEAESECTELVRDDAGTRWVRKLFLRDDPAIEAAYRAIQGTDSPYLPTIRDIHSSPAGTIVVREYFAGPTLREWVRNFGPLDSARARGALTRICLAVQALHACDPPLIHRDINPNNVIVTVEGPRLIDFGITRAYDEHASRDTHTWGTTGYAAPEQFGFDQSDERTDIFALGMLYWFMLTGEDPEGNLGARLRQKGDTRISETARDIILNCVALSPEDRYENVGALVGALKGEVPTQGRAAVSSSSTFVRPIRRILRNVWLVLSSCFMAFIALAVVMTLVEPWRLSVPEGWVRALAFCIGMLIALVPAWLLTTDLFHIRERLPFLREHKLARDVAIVFMAFVTGMLIANAATADLPAAYVTLMQQNGVTTI